MLFITRLRGHYIRLKIREIHPPVVFVAAVAAVVGVDVEEIESSLAPRVATTMTVTERSEAGLASTMHSSVQVVAVVRHD